ncbi:MAG TPA: cell envelope integrity protein TolA [Alphaproteobacteria bacterium]
MLRAAMRSGLLHIAVIVAAYVGLPHLLEEAPTAENVIVVDMVQVAEQRNLPNRMIEPEPQPEPEPEPVKQEAPKVEPPPPPPPPEAAEAPPPVPAPEPAAEPTPPPEPEIAAPAPAPEPTPEPEPEPLAAEAAPLPAEIDRPIRKPEPPSPLDFEQALKSLEAAASEPPQPRREPEPEPAPPAAADPIETLLAAADTPFRRDAPLSMTEIDNIREQIRRNWNVPAGARDAQITEVTLRIQLAQDGTVRRVEVVDQERMRRDPFFRTMAESAVRAVNKTGRIVNLSPDKYHLWRDMVVTFDPKEMFG